MPHIPKQNEWHLQKRENWRERDASRSLFSVFEERGSVLITNNNYEEKGICSRGKMTANCQPSKCPVYTRYHASGLPCFYHVYPDCGYSGRLKDVSGQKIRRQYVNFILAAVVWLMFMVFVAVLTGTLKKDGGTQFTSGEDILSFLVTAGWLVLPFLILSFCNAHFFGQCVCVLRKEGLYSHQRFIRWDDIREMVFHPGLPARTGRNYTYVEVRGDGFTVLLPHAPYRLLRIAGKYNPVIKTKTGMVDVVLFVGVPVTIIFIVALAVYFA